MSELQISLLAVGAVVVASVYGFNRWQERKYRRQTEEAFAAEREDVLLQEVSERRAEEASHRREASLREEPTLVSAAPDSDDVVVEEPGIVELVEPAFSPREEISAPPMEEGRPGPLADETIDYVSTIFAAEAVPSSAVLEVIGSMGDFSKPVHWLGLNTASGKWEKVGEEHDASYNKLVVSLQLADRAGALSEAEMAAFCDAVQIAADHLAAIAEYPERQAALSRAKELDGFGADVDVLIGINVASANGQSFPATKLRALAEAAGMKLEADGAFYLRNEEGDSLFSLCNLDPTPFSTETIKHQSIQGVTFLLDVPKVAGGLRVFGQMVALAKQMAASLEANLVDDHRKPLSDGGIDRIKQQLSGIYARMDACQISAGSPRAQRLFS
jgi:FtsZ-interacting cell division protein ZipA